MADTEQEPQILPEQCGNNVSDPGIDDCGQTMVAGPLADSSGKEISGEELKAMLGADSEATIGVLTDMTSIGMGGIGTVFSAHDPVLHREIAIKILRPAYRNKLNYVTSFIREARITAQIDHPNVIPVHKLGIFDDAGAYFTMKRIRGVTLANILRRLKEGDEELLKTYTRQRLLEIFLAICNGVAFAHSKGIIHRDLKPSNIMVGDYGEVFIADWGLALYREEKDNNNHSGKIQLGLLPDDPQTAGNDGENNQISGTPAFMAPEQVTGKDEDLDELVDVYALGTILYSILTWEQSPFDKVSTVSELVKNVVMRKFQKPRRRAPRRKIPIELEAITLKAMHHNKNRRYQSVIDLQDDVRNYIGKYPVRAYSPWWQRPFKLIQRHPLIPATLLVALLTLGAWNGFIDLQEKMAARSVIIAVENLLDECDTARSKALTARNKLNDFFISSGHTETHGDAAVLRRRYLTASNEFAVAGNSVWENLYRLQQLNCNKDTLAHFYSRLLNNQLQMAQSVNNGNSLEQVVQRINLLPEDLRERVLVMSPNLRNHLQKLQNKQGSLLIKTDSEKLKITACRYDEKGNLQPEAFEIQSNHSNQLDLGSYLIKVLYPDGKSAEFPVQINRNLLKTIDLQLPELKLPENLVYIPRDSFIFGESIFDEQSVSTELPGFFIEKTEVTIAEYLKFWKTLDKEKRERFRAWVDEAPGKVRKLLPLWDESGNLLAPFTSDMPVIGVTSDAVEAYCQYKSRLTGLHYRLPTTLEWEKSARGVDGRIYVWGNEYREGYANINHNALKPYGQRPAAVGSYPKDRSVYGVMDMTGNVRELVRNLNEMPHYAVKGGSCNLSQRFARLAVNAYTADFSELGFRCVVDLPENCKKHPDK